MNTDSNPGDALFVIEEMELNYPNLRAQGIPDLYEIRGFPTLLIIDLEGVLREIHVGYSPTLAEDVIADVEALLTSEAD